MRLLPAILFCAATGLAQDAVDVSQLPQSIDRRINFTSEIQPIFDRSCIKCHGNKRPKSEYQMTSREATMRGGEVGVAVYPGESGRSPLVHSVSYTHLTLPTIYSV